MSSEHVSFKTGVCLGKEVTCLLFNIALENVARDARLKLEEISSNTQYGYFNMQIR
jgi:hypothetical protein